MTKELVFLGWLKPRLWLVDLNYNFECNWLIALSDDKMTDSNLMSELGEKKMSTYSINA